MFSLYVIYLSTSTSFYTFPLRNSIYLPLRTLCYIPLRCLHIYLYVRLLFSLYVVYVSTSTWFYPFPLRNSRYLPVRNYYYCPLRPSMVLLITHNYVFPLYSQLQAMWENYAQTAFSCCHPDFWTVFESVRFQTTACRDRVLSIVKTLVRARGHRWPRSCRVLRGMVSRKSGRFWQNVTNTYVIDLARFELPGVAAVKFSCIDPVYMWITICNTLHSEGIPMQWDPKIL